MTNFWKYHGTGNDFILINNFDKKLSHSPELAINLCDRHFGIGSDGLIIIEKAEDADFKMIFYNPDGSQSFCGNGSRCAVRFAKDQKLIQNKTTNFSAIDGYHHASIEEDEINLQMNTPLISNIRLSENKLPIHNQVVINTGSPHLVLFVDDKLNIIEIDVKHFGSKIRYNSTFKKDGINVNFVGIEATNVIDIRTYERGVEDETLSCGTGVTAAAIAYHHLYTKSIGSQSIEVNAIGGQLHIKFDFRNNEYSNVQLCGPAELVYQGSV